MAENGNVVELRDVVKQYEAPGGGPGRVVLRDLSLAVESGSSLAVVGPSGSGKSTLLNLMGALDTPSSGQVLFQGRDLAAVGEEERARLRNREIGFVFQRHHLLPQCTALENVLIPTLARPRGKGNDEAPALARELLGRVGLGDRLADRPARLSGGECQRVAVVRALIHRPAVLLADEPTGSLDHATAMELAELLAELNRERGVALVVVTHARELAERMGRQLLLRDGQLRPAGGGEA